MNSSGQTPFSASRNSTASMGVRVLGSLYRQDNLLDTSTQVIGKYIRVQNINMYYRIIGGLDPRIPSTSTMPVEKIVFLHSGPFTGSIFKILARYISNFNAPPPNNSSIGAPNKGIFHVTPGFTGNSQGSHSAGHSTGHSTMESVTQRSQNYNNQQNGRHQLGTNDTPQKRYICILPDLRGFGKSDKVGPFTWNQYLSDLEEFLRTMGIGNNYVLFGHDFGGFLAQLFAIHRPEKVSKLILVGTSPCVLHNEIFPLGADEENYNETTEYIQSNYERYLSRYVDLALSEIKDKPGYFSQRFSDSAMPAMFKSQSQIAEPVSGERELIQSLITLGMENNSKFYAEIMQQTKDFNVLEHLGNIKCRTLILHGTDDNLISSAIAHILASNIPKATLHTLAGKGHLPFLTDRKNVLRYVMEFLTDADLTVNF
jgi:pimeloyl-[acyl-carrier protein] methyl ester esterase